MEPPAPPPSLPPSGLEPGHVVGHEVIDDQHRHLLAESVRLGELCVAATAGDEDGQRAFDGAYARLKALARTHFEAELAILNAGGYAELDDHRDACDQFAYLTQEVATTAHFDPVELQRFVHGWLIGHVAGPAATMRRFFTRTCPGIVGAPGRGEDAARVATEPPPA